MELAIRNESSCNGSFEKIGEPTPRKKSKKQKMNAKPSEIRPTAQPRIDVALNALVEPKRSSSQNAHVNPQRMKNSSISGKDSKKENILGGKTEGISRLLFPAAKKPNFVKTESGKQYKISHFFSSDED